MLPQIEAPGTLLLVLPTLYLKFNRVNAVILFSILKAKIHGKFNWTN